MKILDTLIEISKNEVYRDKQKIMNTLFDTSPVFKAWAKLTYGLRHQPNFVDFKDLPELDKKSDGIPEHFDVSSLENVGKKFESALKGKDVDKQVRIKSIIQCFEGVSELEGRFLENVMRGKISYFTIETYQEKIAKEA